MSEQEEFEVWYKTTKNPALIDLYSASIAWMACTDQKNKELEALREFAQNIIKDHRFGVLYNARMSNLIDDDGTPTPLLTGKTNDIPN